MLVRDNKSSELNSKVPTHLASDQNDKGTDFGHFTEKRTVTYLNKFSDRLQNTPGLNLLYSIIFLVALASIGTAHTPLCVNAATASETASSVQYKSNLPVIYINTSDGQAITSKTDYKSGTMYIQGNAEYNDASQLYNGGISIRGRGNTTWKPQKFTKLPYKIKLDKKADLFGFGKNKHWVLLANYMDESLLRNKTAYDLAQQLGVSPISCLHVDVVLNGKFAGNYLFCEQIRTGKNRVDIFSWEGAAEEAADAIAKANNLSSTQSSALEEKMKSNLNWISTGNITYAGTKYKVSDYYDKLPKKEDGTVDTSGGYLFELSEEYDEVSKFRTSTNQPMQFKEPEYASTNSTLMNNATAFIQAAENAFNAPDHYTTYNGKKMHYSELADIDSLVSYWMVFEFYFNGDGMRKSTYMYKDIGGKLMLGPMWDMDWSSNSIVSANTTWDYTQWATNNFNLFAQADQWYKGITSDPYFLTKAYEGYKKYRPYMYDIVKAGGTIDTLQSYLATSAQKNYNNGFLRHSSPFNTEVARLKSFLTSRLDWMDRQFASISTLASSIGRYSPNRAISIDIDQSVPGKTTYTASVSNASVSGIGFYVNGINIGSANVSKGKASLTVGTELLNQNEDELNVVQAFALGSGGGLLNSGNFSNYNTFYSETAHTVEVSFAKEKFVIKAGDEVSLPLRTTVNGNEVADFSQFGDLEVSISPCEGFEKVTKADNIVSFNKETGKLKATGSGIVKIKAKLKDSESESEMALIIPGDLNRDGRLSALDASRLCKILRGSAKVDDKNYGKELADIDADGEITSKDVKLLMETIPAA